VKETKVRYDDIRI